MMLEKYENSVIKNLNQENMKRIIDFLHKNNCDYIDDLLEDYLDIFSFEYNEFVNKFNNLNEKYNNNYIELVREDTNLLEELFY